MSNSISKINKGDKFLCRLSFKIHEQEIFISGREYTSSEDHCITDENGSDQFGWNLEILNNHFLAIQ